MLRMVVGLLVGANVLLASTVSSAQSKPNSASTPAPTVLVFPFAALGEEGRTTAEMLRRNLIPAIHAMPEVDAIDPAVAEKTLGRPLADARDACAEDNACTAALGTAVGATYLVLGGLSTNGDTTLLSLQLFDVSAAKVTKGPHPNTVNSATADLRMKEAAKWLFAQTGELVLKCNVEGADVFIDSLPAGRTALGARPLTVRTGKLNLRVVKPGFETWSKAVDVGPGSQQTIPVDLIAKGRPIAGPTPTPPITKPIIKRPVFWAAVGGVALALGAGAAVAANQGGGGKGETTEEQNPDTFTFTLQ